MTGFLRYLLAQTETRLALAGGGLLLLSLLVEPLGLPLIAAQILQVTALVIAGYPVARSGLANLWINRSMNINLLMTIAAVGALVIGDVSEAATLIFLFDLAEALEGYTTERARRTLSELRELAPSHALRLDESGEALVAVESLRPGDRILVKPESACPSTGMCFTASARSTRRPSPARASPFQRLPATRFTPVR